MKHIFEILPFCRKLAPHFQPFSMIFHNFPRLSTTFHNFPRLSTTFFHDFFPRLSTTFLHRVSNLHMVLWDLGSQTSFSFTGFLRNKKVSFVHSHIHLVITSECFIPSLHSCKHIHPITQIVTTKCLKTSWNNLWKVKMNNMFL